MSDENTFSLFDAYIFFLLIHLDFSIQCCARTDYLESPVPHYINCRFIFHLIFATPLTSNEICNILRHKIYPPFHESLFYISSHIRGSLYI